MRARCERHALALGPSGCLICRREEGVVAESSDADALADTARSAPPAALIASAAPAPVAAPAPTNAPPAATATAATSAYRDSAPTVPIVTDAPASRRLSIRIPPMLMLLLPVAAFGVYSFVAHRPTLPTRTESEPSSRNAEASSTVAHPPPAEAAPMLDDLDEPVDPPSVTAVKIAVLERTREQALRAADQLGAARRRVKVVLYSTARCTRCTEARSHLLAQGIHPTERDIDKDPRARARHRALSKKGGLPTIEVDGKVLVGFQPESLDKAIDRAATARTQRKQ